MVGKLILNQPPKILDKLSAFCDKSLGFLVLAGKNGTGKTYAAHAIIELLSLQEKYHDSDHRHLITQAALNIAWQKQIEDWKSTLYMLNVYNRYKILCLDDVGTRVPSPAFMDFLYTIVDYRWENRDSLGTIITTNLTSQDMREKLGDAFVSRISSGINIRFEGKDRRINEW